MNPEKLPKIKTEAKDLVPVAEYVNEVYDGNLLSLTQWLDRAVYMFHFISEDENFSSQDKRGVVDSLMVLKERLIEAHYRQRGIRFKRMA